MEKMAWALALKNGKGFEWGFMIFTFWVQMIMFEWIWQQMFW